MELDKITMTSDSGESVDLYVLEETRLNGTDYLLTSDDPESEETECYILKDVSKDGDEEAVYEFVEDDTELAVIFKVFEQLMADEDVTFVQ